MATRTYVKTSGISRLAVEQSDNGTVVVMILGNNSVKAFALTTQEDLVSAIAPALLDTDGSSSSPSDLDILLARIAYLRQEFLLTKWTFSLEKRSHIGGRDYILGIYHGDMGQLHGLVFAHKGDNRAVLHASDPIQPFIEEMWKVADQEAFASNHSEQKEER